MDRNTYTHIHIENNICEVYVPKLNSLTNILILFTFNSSGIFKVELWRMCKQSKMNEKCYSENEKLLKVRFAKLKEQRR